MDFIYTYGTQAQTVAPTLLVYAPIIARRYGNLDTFNGGVSIGSSGWYKVSGSVTFTSTAGAAEISIYQDGVEVLGATSSLTAVADTTYTLNVEAIIRKTGCPCNKDIVNIVNTGATTLTVSNASMILEKM